MGRSLKLTDEVEERILSALRAGNYQETAAAFAGVSKQTYYRWLKLGESDEPDNQRFREFRDAVEQARAAAEVRSVALINRAADSGTWQAAAWYLERSHPKKWGRLDRSEITGADGGPLQVEIDHKQALLDLYERVMDDDPPVS